MRTTTAPAVRSFAPADLAYVAVFAAGARWITLRRDIS